MRLLAASCVCALVVPAATGAQSPGGRYVGRSVTAVEVAIEGTPVLDPVLADLIDTRVGRPLAMDEVRDSIAHLYNAGRFQDVRVDASDADGGVRLRFELTPLHAVERVEFTGDLGLSSGLLRDRMAERFGRTPSIDRVDDVVRLLTQLYEDRGYRRATIAPRATELHDPDRTIITFEIASGPRAHIGRVDVVGDPLEPVPAFLRRIGAASGSVYEHTEIQTSLAEYVRRLKSRGRYDAEATLGPPALSTDGAAADLTIEVRPGPIITIGFEGDPVPRDHWDELVPLEQEGSADEDLLEDSARRIRDYLAQQGYWRAQVSFDRRPAGEQMRIVFTVRRGLQYRIADGVEIGGNRAIPADELRPLAEGLGAGDLFVASRLTAAQTAIGGLYRSRGYALVKVDATETELNPVRPGEGLVKPVISVTEGPQVLIGAIRFVGNASVPESELLGVLRLEPNVPFRREAAAEDEENVLVHYYNLGFASATVALALRPTQDGSRVDLEFRIVEGPRALVHRIIVVGNRRTDPNIIRRELRLHPGQPLGLEDRLESQRRVAALGLFRRVSVQPSSHGDDARPDVLVIVEEAPATSVGFGGGAEVSRLLRPTGPGGAAEERFEFAPRGFFNIGRRNLGGKNRSVNLFTRVSLRPDDSVDDPGGSPFGFADYRVIATYRQPRLLGANDATVTGALEQGVRSSFNFARKGVIAELSRALAPGIVAAFRYSFGWTKTFDKGVGEADQAYIDRVFPQVRLSGFSGAVSRDTRDNLISPTRGTFLSGEGSVAARALGGQVGFMKTYLQGFWFREVPGMNGTVFATRGAVGLADGFTRVVPELDPVTGEPIPGVFKEVEELPASERFFAGGDTTIRGYALDTVGAPNTISPTGFPSGGNAVLIMNGELRFPPWKDLAPVVFIDGGNVFERVTQFDLGELRGAAGFGLRYLSPVGPIRVDVGFKFDRRVLGASLEDRYEVHLSIGHAF
jgi:outer membrane protein assembly factor BamA